MADLSLSGLIWRPSGFEPGRITIEGDLIKTVEFGRDLPADFSFDGYICPGFIDIQLNGGLGHDFTRDPATIAPVSTALPRWGVTSYLPTLITAPLETYLAAFKWLAAHAVELTGARVLGLHLEGPYLNPSFSGAHPKEFLRQPNLAEMKNLFEQSQGWFKLATLAPELPGNLELARFLEQNGVAVAAGHSGATLEEARQAFTAGIKGVTHLFNAQPPLHHRQPGLVGATLLEPTVMSHLIVDGLHLHPAMVDLIYRLKGADRIILTTDAMAGLGMPPGVFDLAGQSVIVDEKSARLSDSPQTLAGSILKMNEAVANMVGFTGCDPAVAVQMATLNPARLLGLEKQTGQLEPGFTADIAVLSRTFEVKQTIIGGEIVFTA